MSATIKVKLVRSGVSQSQGVQRTLRALRLTRMNRTVLVKDTPAQRGMVEKVRHLVLIEENQG